jgi:DNA-binding NarL/FixJ family response regulator
MIRCLIADDHPIIRSGLRGLIQLHSDMAEPGEAATAAETLDMVRTSTWDLVILDINLPDASGIDVLRRIRHLRPDLPVLMLSAHAEEQFAMRSLRAGASGYLSKQLAAEELIVAIRRVLSGRRYVSDALAEQLAAALDPAATDREPHETLSDREFQVLRLIGGGRTVSEIAESLHLSVKTVSTYRARLLEKLSLTTTAQLAAYAIRAGLVLPTRPSFTAVAIS